MEKTIFNKKDFYKHEIEPKVDEIVKICGREKIPMFFSAAVANDENHTDYMNEMISAYSNNVELTNDLIPKFVNVTNGFNTVPSSDTMEIDF